MLQIETNASPPVQAEIRDRAIYPVYMEGETYDQWLGRLAKNLGTENTSLAEYIMRNLNLCDKHPTTEAFNARLGMLQEIKAKDDAELILLCEMLITNRIALDAIAQANKCYDLAEKEKLSNISIRYMHLYARQLESLRRYRKTGNQLIQVIHSNQAIIGDIYNDGNKNEVINGYNK